MSKTNSNKVSKSSNRRGEPMFAGGRMVGTIGALEVVCYEPERWEAMCAHFDRLG